MPTLGRMNQEWRKRERESLRQNKLVLDSSCGVVAVVVA